MKVTNNQWELLLKIKTVFKTVNLEKECFCINDKMQLKIIKNKDLRKDCMIIEKDEHFLYNINSNNLKKYRKLVTILKVYLPFIWIDVKSELPLLTVHIAQSLDGKIATITGNSKWIGNKENLIHAHRVRALVDGVMIGGNTLRKDKPKLNVRHVSGSDPIKIIITNKQNDYSSLLTKTDSKIIVCTSIVQKTNENIKCIYFDHDDDFIINPVKVLKNLKSQGINSILLEGGNKTIKEFMQLKLVNYIEFHIAPIILGSGINSIDLPVITKLSNATQLLCPNYLKMGNAIMIRSYLNNYYEV